LENRAAQSQMARASNNHSGFLQIRVAQKQFSILYFQGIFQENRRPGSSGNRNFTEQELIPWQTPEGCASPRRSSRRSIGERPCRQAAQVHAQPIVCKPSLRQQEWNSLDLHVSMTYTPLSSQALFHPTLFQVD
jgi:hypothetical protein